MRKPLCHLPRRAAAAAAISTACVFGAIGTAFAQPAVNPPAPTASSAATGNRNVYAGGGQVRPPGSVQGDYTAAGGKVIVDQPVEGDAALAGGSVDVRAPVADDVRAVAGDISIESSVGGELFATGGNIVLTPSAAVGRGASLYGSNVSVEGRVGGALNVTAQTVRVNGEIGGNVRLVAEEIEIGPQARIGGRLDYVSGNELKRAEGAVIAGAITREAGTREAQPRPGSRSWQWQWKRSMQGPAPVPGVMSFLALLACAAVFLLLVPAFGHQTSERIRRMPGLALAIGLAAVVTVPVLAILLFVTILGIPLGLTVLALYPVLLLVGFVAGVLFLADLMPARLRRPLPQTTLARMGYFALALLLVLLAGWLPFVGGLLLAALGLAGIGAVVLELHARLPGRKPPVGGQPSLSQPARQASGNG